MTLFCVRGLSFNYLWGRGQVRPGAPDPIGSLQNREFTAGSSCLEQVEQDMVPFASIYVRTEF